MSISLFWAVFMFLFQQFVYLKKITRKLFVTFYLNLRLLMVSCEQTVFLCYNAVISQYSVNEFYLHVWVSTNWQEKSFSWNLRTRLRFSLLFTIAVSLGERVSGKGADLYEMCDELDALLTGNISGTWSVYCIPSTYVFVLDTYNFGNVSPISIHMYHSITPLFR